MFETVVEIIVLEAKFRYINFKRVMFYDKRCNITKLFLSFKIFQTDNVKIT